MDNCLKFTNHAYAVQLKCLRFIGLIFKLFYTRNADTFIKLFPTIDYGAIIYTNTSRNVERSIEKIQRIFTKRLFKKLYPHKDLPNYDDRLRFFSLESLKARYCKMGLVTIYKLRSGLLSIDGINLRSSSHHLNRILLPSAHSALYRNSFLFRNVVLWNRLIPKRSFVSLHEFITFVNSISFD